MAATSMASSIVLKSSPAALSSARSSVAGASFEVAKPVSVAVRTSVVCRAEKAEESAVSRRAALTLLAGAAALTVKASPAEAAYGEAANIFAPAKKQTGFIPYSGTGFSLDVPAKWNPSKEIEFPGTVVRFEDNFDATNNLAVMITPSSKSSIKDYGSPEDFLQEVSFLLGKQTATFITSSEGGFADNAVATASVLSSEAVNLGGKDYFKLSLLTRTADGDEGGKHQLITAAVNDGKLYVLKVQAGDKRWFKGAKKFAEGAVESFLVA